MFNNEFIYSSGDNKINIKTNQQFFFSGDLEKTNLKKGDVKDFKIVTLEPLALIDHAFLNLE